jgi:hypothetical protein
MVTAAAVAAAVMLTAAPAPAHMRTTRPEATCTAQHKNSYNAHRGLLLLQHHRRSRTGINSDDSQQFNAHTDTCARKRALRQHQ